MEEKVCDKCGSVLKPAPSKLHASGEQSYCGFIPCLCDKVIMTDFGAVYPGTEDHTLLMLTKK